MHDQPSDDNTASEPIIEAPVAAEPAAEAPAAEAERLVATWRAGAGRVAAVVEALPEPAAPVSLFTHRAGEWREIP